MRARPNLSSDRLVQDYLARVAAAARHLPKGARMAFVGRTKSQIERQVTAAGTDDPGKVVEILAALGEPEELVREERLRIDSKWLKKRGRDEESEAATPGTPSNPRVYQPRVHRRLNSRWRPATPPPRKPEAQPGDALDGAQTGTANGAILPSSSATAPELTGPAPVGPAPIGPAAAAPESTRPEFTEPAPTGPAPTGPAPTGPAPTGPAPTGLAPTSPPPWPGDLDAMMPPGPAPGEDGTAPGPQTPLDGIWELSRRHLLESVAVVVIGLGGAILPFPFWLAGAVVALFSRLWGGREKVAAFGGPILVVLVGSVLSAIFIGGTSNVVAIYLHALHVEASLWIRLGCVLTAIYLGWRVSQGKRVKVPPWKR
jgi:hypothetical protein